MAPRNPYSTPHLPRSMHPRLQSQRSPRSTQAHRHTVPRWHQPRWCTSCSSSTEPSTVRTRRTALHWRSSTRSRGMCRGPHCSTPSVSTCWHCSTRRSRGQRPGTSHTCCRILVPAGSIRFPVQRRFRTHSTQVRPCKRRHSLCTPQQSTAHSCRIHTCPDSSSHTWSAPAHST